MNSNLDLLQRIVWTITTLTDGQCDNHKLPLHQCLICHRMQSTLPKPMNSVIQLSTIIELLISSMLVPDAPYNHDATTKWSTLNSDSIPWGTTQRILPQYFAFASVKNRPIVSAEIEITAYAILRRQLPYAENLSNFILFPGAHNINGKMISFMDYK